MPVLSGRDMWKVLFLGVLYHETFCGKKQLLSEAVDAELEHHPVFVYAFTAVTVAHLLNWLPNKVDPYRWVWLVVHTASRRWETNLSKGNHARSVRRCAR